MFNMINEYVDESTIYYIILLAVFLIFLYIMYTTYSTQVSVIEGLTSNKCKMDKQKTEINKN